MGISSKRRGTIIFTINRRWRQIGESEGVSLHLLECLGVGEVFKTRYASEKSPKTFLDQDEELSHVRTREIANLTKNISRFVLAAEKVCSPFNKFLKIARHGPSLPDREKDVMKGVVENFSFAKRESGMNPRSTLLNERIPFDRLVGNGESDGDESSEKASLFLSQR